MNIGKISTLSLVVWIISITFGYGTAEARGETLAGPFPIEIMRVIDGDTYAVRVRLWISQKVETHVRLAGADTPEIRGKCATEKELAHKATEFARAWLRDRPLVLENVRQDKYAGRVIAQVRDGESGAMLSEALLAQGLARPYDGAARSDWCRQAALHPQPPQH